MTLTIFRLVARFSCLNLMMNNFSHFLSPLFLHSGVLEPIKCVFEQVWGYAQDKSPSFWTAIRTHAHCYGPFQVARCFTCMFLDCRGKSGYPERTHSDTRSRTPHRENPSPVHWACDLLAVRWQCSYLMWQLQFYSSAAVEASALISKQQPQFTMVSSFPSLVFLLSFLKNQLGAVASSPCTACHVISQRSRLVLESTEILKTGWKLPWMMGFSIQLQLLHQFESPSCI